MQIVLTLGTFVFCLSYVYGARYEYCRDGVVGFCTVEAVMYTPWSTNESPAPQPTVESFTCFTPKNSSSIGLNITWSQAEQELKGFVEGYYMHLTSLEGLLDRKLQFKVNKSSMTQWRQNKKVFINYIYIGKMGDIRTHQTVFLELHSLPMYQINTTNQGVLEVLKCTDDSSEVQSYHVSENSRTVAFTTTTLPNDLVPMQSDNFVNWIIVGTVLSIFALCGLQCILYKKGILKQGCQSHLHKEITLQKECKRTFLVLVSTNGDNSNSLYYKAALYFSNFLKHNENHDVVCNLWEQTCDNAAKWTTEKLKKASVVILFCTPSGKKTWKNFTSVRHSCYADPFVTGMEAFVNNESAAIIGKGTNFYVAFVDTDSSKSIPDVPQLKSITIKVPEEIKKLYPIPKSCDVAKKQLYCLNDVVTRIRNGLEETYVNLGDHVPMLHNTERFCTPVVQLIDSIHTSSIASNDYFGASEPSCDGIGCSCNDLSL
uniref:Uncharacterized protein LOC100177305 n=1 Tax=Phallusia mammillata TaxID=59560 RepID=A0A6F9DFY6_9ASCI|nr:uncharacterized protein LOC100177305 [Phallusia mammillata]